MAGRWRVNMIDIVSISIIVYGIPYIQNSYIVYIKNYFNFYK